MKPLYPDNYWEVEINWSRPRTYERVRDEGHELDECAYLYLVTAKYSKTKTIYVGKTYHQTVSVRLKQQDHLDRYAAFVKNYPNHRFYVSLGQVKVLNGKITSSRIDSIERILIYANEPDHAHNVSSFYEHGVKGSYHIFNRGSKAGLPREIMLGVFAK